MPLLPSVEAVLPGLEAKQHEQARSWAWLSEAVGDAHHMGVLYRQWELIPTTTPAMKTFRVITIVEKQYTNSTLFFFLQCSLGEL